MEDGMSGTAVAVTEARQATQTAQPPRFSPKFVVAASFGSVLNPVNSSIIAVALVSIGKAFGIGADSTAWLLSALYLATAIGQPTMGRLADLVGPRKVYLTGTVLVGLGGLIGFLANSLLTLVIARVVIGFGTSAAYPAALAMVRRQSQRLHLDAPGSVLGALAVAGQVSFAVGPPLGGLLIAIGGWRLTFLINLPLALAGLMSVLRWLPKDETRDTTRSTVQALDPAGLALFAVALTGLLVFLMDLAAPRWWLLAATAVMLAALTGRELHARSPFIDVRLLARNRALTTTYLRFGLTMLITYCFIYGWTLWLEQADGRSAASAGLLIAPAFAVATVASALGARARRLWPPLVAGAAALTVVSGLLLVLHANESLWMLLAVAVVFGLQFGLTVVTNQAAMYAQAPAGATGAAAGLLRTFMYVGAIASASVISLCYGLQATDAGLHRMALLLTIAALGLLVATIADRSLARQRGPQTTGQRRALRPVFSRSFGNDGP
jgi:MFS family permease